MHHEPSDDDDRGVSFDDLADGWLAPRRDSRPSQRPTRPAPPPPSVDDNTLDGWIYDIACVRTS
jgi:hypothetical protein